MTLQDFVAANDGTKILENFAGLNPYGAQCVNLVNRWCRGLGIEQFVGNANDFEFDAHPDCDWTANTPTNIPRAGDIVVWGKSGVLPFGHVAVFIEGNVNTFTTFDQNWPGGSACHRQGHNYTSPPVKGWFHPRVLDAIDWQAKYQEAQAQLTAVSAQRDHLQASLASAKQLATQIGAL